MYKSYLEKGGSNNKQNVSKLKLTYTEPKKKNGSNCCRITGDP